MNPEIKIILIVCDPVNRAYSDFAQVIKRKEFPNIVEYIPDGDIEDDSLRMNSFEKFINDYLEKTETKRDDLNDEDFIHWVRTVYRWVKTSHKIHPKLSHHRISRSLQPIKQSKNPKQNSSEIWILF